MMPKSQLYSVRTAWRGDTLEGAVRRLLLIAISILPLALAEPSAETRFVFPLEPLHNHSSSVVELPDGSLFAVWFRGSGERRADDVQVMGARLANGAVRWTRPFLVADYPGFPDTNCTLFLDHDGRLWLFWMTFIANEVETTVINYRVSSDYLQPDGPPRWERQELLLLKHDLERFEAKVRSVAEPELARAEGDWAAYLRGLIENAGDKFVSRMGWMVRTHPQQLPSGRILVPLYSDVYDFSLMALSDDGGTTWRPSEPIVGFGAVQPSAVRRRDGTLAVFMRDNGPPPKRILYSESQDGGETWMTVRDLDLPNPGASVEAIALQDGRWLLVWNDLERGRHSLAVSLSEDEGRTWRWTRHLERGEGGEGAASYHYPSVIQARDGTIHATYSYFLNHLPEGAPRKAIKHASFPAEWVLQGGADAEKVEK